MKRKWAERNFRRDPIAHSEAIQPTQKPNGGRPTQVTHKRVFSHCLMFTAKPTLSLHEMHVGKSRKIARTYRIMLLKSHVMMKSRLYDNVVETISNSFALNFQFYVVLSWSYSFVVGVFPLFDFVVIHSHMVRIDTEFTFCQLSPTCHHHHRPSISMEKRKKTK